MLGSKSTYYGGRKMHFTFHQKLLVLLMMTFLSGLLFSDEAVSAEKKDKAAKRAALMMQKIKQDMETEKAAMQAQFDAQKKQFEDQLKLQEETLQDLDKQLQQSQSKVLHLSAESKKLKSENAALDATLRKTESELGLTKQTLADLTVQHKQALSDLKFNDGQRKTQAIHLAETTKSLNACVEKNDRLYNYGKELVQIYDQPSRYEAMMRKESFFQLKRVELENILQDKLDQIDQAKVQSHAAY